MKRNIIFGGLLGCAALLTGCDDLSPEAVDFQVTANKTIVHVGEPVTFSFDGNPNFITFFSGEEGHKFVHRNRVELDPSDIASSTLSFTADSKYGTQTGTFKVYLSKDFPGLSLKSAEADKALIESHAWTDMTEACGVVDGKKVVVKDVDLSAYQGGLVLAFRFLGTTEATPQRTLIITGLTIKNELKNGKTTELKGSDLNFNCFDVTPSNPDHDPYKKVVSGSLMDGTWSLIKLLTNNEIQIRGGNDKSATWANNDDWLIAEKLQLNACTPDAGENIKDISRRLSTYTYLFEKPGVYTVTFLAGNASVDGQKSVVKELKIEVKAAE